MSPGPLPRRAPTDHGVDPAAVLAFVDAVEADPDVELHSLMVVRHGAVVAEGWWAPHTPDRPRLLYSLSKSFTSTALAFGVAEGLVGLDDTVLSHFPELDDEITDPGSRSITVRHLASMASGHGREMRETALANDPHEPVRGFLLAPPAQAPGSVFAYSQPCTYTVGAILQRAAGTALSEYLRPRLLDPLGIGEIGWLTWPPGREQGFSGLFARTEDVAKLGLLHLQGGRWDGAQLIAEDYVAQATSHQVDTAPVETNPDWAQGYGFCFWMARHGYRGDGAFGQFCVVLPEQDTVVAMTGGTEAMQAVLDHLWAHLLPGLDDSPVDERRQAELDRRLRDLALPTPVTAGAGPADRTGGHFRVGPPDGTPEGAPTSFVSVGLHRDTGGTRVTLSEADDGVTFPVEPGRWVTSEPRGGDGAPVPVAASGGWVDADTFRAEVVFLETPHRLDLTCSVGSGQASVSWRTTPLDGGRLQTLHRPRS